MDAIGKMKNIEEIDQRFFGTLLENIDTEKVVVMISADHSTPCINKGHSDHPVPLLISGDKIKNVENRLVLFPCNVLHTGVTQTDTKVRVAITFNYFSKDK